MITIVFDIFQKLWDSTERNSKPSPLTDIGVTRIVFLTGRWRDLDVQLQVHKMHLIFQAKKA